MSMTNNEIRAKIDEWFALHTDAMLDDLGQLISIESVRGVAEKDAPHGRKSHEALMFVQAMLEKRGYAVRNFENSVITSDIGPTPPFMGILAHVDVVGVGDGWETDPFKMVIKDGKIFGRGASDDKGPAIAALYAMFCAHEIYPEFKKGFQILMGSDEEMGCLDITHYLEKNMPPPNVFTPDAGYPLVNTEKGRITPFFKASWEKDKTLPRIISIMGGKTTNIVPDRAEAAIEGISFIEAQEFCNEYSQKTGVSITADEQGGVITIVVEGISTHAASPELGNNAQTALIEMLVAMPFAQCEGFKHICALNRLFPHGDFLGNALGIAMSDELTGMLTLNFGVLAYTDTEVTANFDSRTPLCADDIDLVDRVVAALEREGFTITYNTHSSCHHTPEDSLFVQTLMRIYREYTGDNEGKCLSMGGQTYVHDIPGGVAFGCAMPGVENNVHGANEFISMDNLIISAKMFASAIIEMCG